MSMEDVNSQFNNELQQQIDGILPKGHTYRLGNAGCVLQSAGIPDLPIELKALILNKKANAPRHSFRLEEIIDLPKAINNPLAVFSYGDPTKAVNIITEITHNEKNFLVGLSLNPMVQGKKIEINEIRNVFPKDTHEWMNWIKQGKGLYFNKEKVLNLLDQQQMTPAEVAFGLPAKQAQQGDSKSKLILSCDDIESIINIVNNFNNVK